jgi:hypothetical protein
LTEATSSGVTEEAAGVRIALVHGLHHRFGLFAGYVRRQWRNVGVDDSVEHARAVGGEGLLPGRPDILGAVDADASQT